MSDLVGRVGGMSSQAPEARSVQEQVRVAVDPRGQSSSFEAIRPLLGASALLARSRVGFFVKLNRLLETGAAYADQLRMIESAIQVLHPLGWAVFSIDTAVIAEAVGLVEQGNTERADELLASQWEGDAAWRTARTCQRVRAMMVGHPELRDLYVDRARLLKKAKEHHEAGRYEASIPLLQAQMEGIVMDVTGGKKFFTKGSQKADLCDPVTL